MIVKQLSTRSTDYSVLVKLLRGYRLKFKMCLKLVFLSLNEMYNTCHDCKASQPGLQFL